MSDHADWTIERRLLLGALICAVLLIGGYFVFVSLPWGHQFDDDAYFGRKALSRNVVKLDSDIIGLVSTRALLIGNGPDCHWNRAPLCSCRCNRGGGIWMRGGGR
jgi:hypothetical protein